MWDTITKPKFGHRWEIAFYILLQLLIHTMDRSGHSHTMIPVSSAHSNRVMATSIDFKMASSILWLINFCRLIFRPSSCIGSKNSNIISMMTSSNGNISCITGPLWWQSTGHRWIPLTKAKNLELWCFLWSAPEQAVQQAIETPVIWDAIMIIITSL